MSPSHTPPNPVQLNLLDIISHPLTPSVFAALPPPTPTTRNRLRESRGFTWSMPVPRRLPTQGKGPPETPVELN